MMRLTMTTMVSLSVRLIRAAGMTHHKLGDDCDDNDVLINPDTVWFADSDVDGGDAGNTQFSVTAKWLLSDDTDCDDGDGIPVRWIRLMVK